VSAGLAAAGKSILSDLSWRIPRTAVTAILGPAGTGKSLLAQALSGRTPRGVERKGTWLHDGKPLSMREGNADIAWLGQVRPPRSSERRAASPPRWAELLQSDTKVLVLDEPTVDVTEEEAGVLARELRTRSLRGAVILVTHDLSFARNVADEIGLLVAGRLEAATDAARFFSSPPTPLALKFVKHGNCWPAAPLVPELPGHFAWVIPERLAGMGRPGLLRDMETDLAAIAGAGISMLVSLTGEPVPQTALRAFGLQGRHFPVPDMGVPAIGPAARLCRDVERNILAGGAVAIHCQAGLGRTGTMLASILVWMGKRPEEAIREVRSVNDRFIQNAAQESFVERFAESAGRPANGYG
jgi:atypical dual specificity phosphatase